MMKVSLYNTSYSSLISYMEEIGWFNNFVYVVWLHGATDGWPNAIFLDKKRAEQWAENVNCNPEGYSIQKINFSDLICHATGIEEF